MNNNNQIVWFKNNIDIKLNVLSFDFYQENMINSFIVANIIKKKNMELKKKIIIFDKVKKYLIFIFL